MQTSKYEIGANLQGLEFRRQANEILAALASSNAGNLEPASAQAGTVWLDTSNDKKHLLKIRNKANNAWGILCSIDAQSGAVDAIDAYSKTQSDDKFLEKTQANLFIQKDKFNAYTNEEPLPAGDMNSKDYWLQIKPGFYWFNSEAGGYTNHPATYAHVLVLRHPDSSDLQVFFFRHPTNDVFHLAANGSSSTGWMSFNQGLGVGQEYKNLIGQRRANEIYTNDTGRPIYVNIGVKVNASGERNLKINGVIVDTAAMGAAPQHANALLVKGIVPPGATYSVDGSVNFWFELR